MFSFHNLFNTSDHHIMQEAVEKQRQKTRFRIKLLFVVTLILLFLNIVLKLVCGFYWVALKYSVIFICIFIMASYFFQKFNNITDDTTDHNAILVQADEFINQTTKEPSEELILENDESQASTFSTSTYRASNYFRKE